MPSTQRLAGKVAFVTGAARGQGRAEALLLAREGAAIIAADNCAQVPGTRYPAPLPEDLEATARTIQDEGGRALTGQVDIRDLGSLEELVRQGTAEFGPLDIVVATAGISSWDLLMDMSEEKWDTMIDINLSGAWRTLKATIPSMIEGGRGGSVVVKGSVAAVKALPLLGHYTAAKAGLVGLVKTAAIELAPHRIRVNVIHPWGVKTPMGGSGPSIPDEYPQFVPSFSMVLGDSACEPDDIAKVTLFLASDDSAYMTGAAIEVDMGATLV